MLRGLRGVQEDLSKKLGRRRRIRTGNVHVGLNHNVANSSIVDSRQQFFSRIDDSKILQRGSRRGSRLSTRRVSERQPWDDFGEHRQRWAHRVNEVRSLLYQILKCDAAASLRRAAVYSRAISGHRSHEDLKQGNADRRAHDHLIVINKEYADVLKAT